MALDVVARGDLPFPRSLPEFQRLFPDEAACAAYLERAGWSGRYAGRVRLAVVPDRSARALGGFVKTVVAPGARIITDDWSVYAGLAKHGFNHVAIAERGDPQVAEEFMPIVHLVFSNLKTWLRGR